MSMKEAMKKYFKRRKEAHDHGLEFLFKTPFNDDVAPFIYEGEVNEEEYISWKPVKKKHLS